MRRDVSNRLIGLFVVVGVSIMFVFVILFGVGKYFHEERKFVLYFNGSLHGLIVGAPVEFRGVQVGEVEEIRVEVSQQSNTLTLPVIVSIQPYRLVEIDKVKSKSDGHVLKKMIDDGLSAELKAESLLTGSLYIELDHRPKEKVKMRGYSTKYPEIPTVESRAEQLSDIITSARNTLDSIEKFVSSDKLKQSIEDLSAMMKKGKKTMEAGEKTIDKIDNYIDPVSTRLLDSVKGLPDMTDSVRSLVDYLSRHPEALIKGKR